MRLSLPRATAIAAALTVGFLSSISSAALIGINPTNFPIDIVSGQIPVSYSYNSTTGIGTFTTGAGGVTQQIRTSVGGPTVNLANPGVFSLTASFKVDAPANTFNTTVSSLTGSINLTGGVNAGDPAATVLMASNNLLQFGFSNGGSPTKHFEFVFAPGTGVYGGLGPINVVLHVPLSGNPALASYNTGYLTASFGQTAPVLSTADTVVPLPPAALAGLSSLAGLALYRLRRRSV
jgi:hypothetical protein